MTFWVNVGLCYLLLLGLGLAAGAYLGSRGHRDDRGRGGEPTPQPVPPTGPAHATEWLPLGSDFDRALLPGAFAEEAAPALTWH